MKMLFKLFVTAATLVVFSTLCLAGNNPSRPPDTPIYVLTNDDGILHNYVGFYLAGGTQGAPTLTYQNAVNTGGKGIGGGFFAAPRCEPVTRCCCAVCVRFECHHGRYFRHQYPDADPGRSISCVGHGRGRRQRHWIGAERQLFVCRIQYLEHDCHFLCPAGMCALLCQRRAGGRPERRFAVRHGPAWQHPGGGLRRWVG